jgi:hypothetical protein
LPTDRCTIHRTVKTQSPDEILGRDSVYQHCGTQHLHRYLAEYDFRYSNRVALGINDAERTAKALIGIVGKRMTYRRTGERRVA